MIVLQKGCIYKSEGSQGYTLDLVFSHRDETGKFIPGLLNEDVIKILMDRLQAQNQKQPDDNTFQASLHLQQAYQQLHMRNKKMQSKRQKSNPDSLTNLIE